MNRNRLLHTTAIRLALRYTLFYAVLTSIGLGILYWATSRYVDAQIAASLESELADLVQIDLTQGRQKLLRVISGRSEISFESRRYILLTSPDGKKIAGYLKSWPPGISLDTHVRNVWIEDNYIPGRKEDQDGYWPVIATTLNDGSHLLVSQSIKQAEDLQDYIQSAMITLLAVIVLLTLILGWRMSEQMLERVDLINNTARHILKGNMASRVSKSGHDDEFDDIADNLNQMLDHIERLIKGMQDVTDNVAHDLRSPLTRLLNRLEITLLETRSENEYRDTIETTISEVKDIIRSFNALLEITQTKAGSFRGEWELINMSTLARDIGELYQGNAEDNGQTLQLDIEPEINIQGNRHLLGQTISNLLENALKYSGQGSNIKLTLMSNKGEPVLEVSDTGPGIPSTEHKHVLERFVRLDSSRSTSGNGLGLSLVSAVAELHNANLTLYDNHPGLRVTINFKQSDFNSSKSQPI